MTDQILFAEVDTTPAPIPPRVKRVSPKTFPAEIAAAGLSNIPMSWDLEGRIVFAASVSRSDRDRVLSVLAAHDPINGDKLEKRADINRARDAAESGGFPYLGKIFDSDSTSVQRISIAAQAAQLALQTNQPFSVTWKAKDNTDINLTSAQMVQMPAALATFAAALHAKANQLKALVDAARTLADLDAIQW